MSFMDELRKIPPVTRFLCGSSLAVSLPAILQTVSPYEFYFIKEKIIQQYEIWRVYTTFFYGGSGLGYVFHFVMLYQNSNQLESTHYIGKSSDYAWQLLIAAGAILAINLPLSSLLHGRPLLICLTYLTSRLAPPGAQTSLFGLLTIPLIYFPYALICLDLLMGGPREAAASVAGAIVGHLWWWGVYHTRTLEAFGKAPRWLRAVIDGPSRPGNAGDATAGPGGVHVIPPRRVREEAAGTSSGYRWGTGQKLGGS